MAHHTKKRFGIGLIIGAITGLVAGLLTAPKSGKETRDDLKKKASEVKDEADAKAEQAKQKADDVVAATKEKAKVVREYAESAVEGAKSGWNKSEEKAEAAKKAEAHKK